MAVIPMPIVMGMVAGVFLRFALDLVFAIRDDAWVAVPMTATFLLLSAWPRLARGLPPLIGALVVGIAVVATLGRLDPSAAAGSALVRPTLYWPAFSWPAMIELVVPVVITVLVVQNGQGIAVLRAAGHQPPVDAITGACGAWSMLTALVGSVSTCLTGPVNAIISGSGDRTRHYTAGILVGLLGMGFGVFAPVAVGLMLAAPRTFIAALAGLAMLRVLQTAFTIAFRDRFTLAALVTLVVTVADVAIWSIGAPFWGLMLGGGVAWLLERGDLEARS
jgi:benzoate membrane transport protein